MTRRIVACLILAALLSQRSGPIAIGADKPAAKSVNESKGHAETAAILQVLQTPISIDKAMKEFMPLAKATEYVQERLAARGMSISIVVDHESLSGKDAADIIAGRLPPRPFPVSLALLPANAKAQHVLEKLVAQVPDAAYLIRQGRVDIVNKDDTTADRLIRQPIVIAFEQKPLREVLSDLANLTGLSINLDPCLGEQAKMPLTLVIRNSVPLNEVLQTVTGMAGLRFRLLEHSVYVSTREKVDTFQRE